MATVAYVTKMLTRKLADSDFDSPTLMACKQLTNFIAENAGFCPITDKRYTGDFSEEQTCLVTDAEAYAAARPTFQQSTVEDKKGSKEKGKETVVNNIYASLVAHNGKKIIFTAGMDADFPGGITGGVSFSAFLFGAANRPDFTPLKNCVQSHAFKASFVPTDVMATHDATIIGAHKKEALRNITLNQQVAATAIEYIKANMKKCAPDIRKGYRSNPDHVRQTLKYPFTPYPDEAQDEEEAEPLDKARRNLELPTVMDSQNHYAVGGCNSVGVILNTKWANRFGKPFSPKSYSKSDPDACFQSKETLVEYGAALHSMPVYIFSQNNWVPLDKVSFFNLNCGGRWIVAYHPVLLMSKDKGNSIKNILVAAYLVAPPSATQQVSDTTALQSVMAVAKLKRPYDDIGVEEDSDPEAPGHGQGDGAPADDRRKVPRMAYPPKNEDGSIPQ